MAQRRFVYLLVLVASLSVMAAVPPNSQDWGRVTQNGVSYVAGRNVNMVSGLVWPWGDEFLERQNEPSIAVSTRNPYHLLAGANDYRTLNWEFQDEVTGDAWLGLYWSTNGGESWYSTLHPGYPGSSGHSPLSGLQAAADPTLRAGPNGLFFYSGIAFDRLENGDSVVFLSRLVDNNDTEHFDPNASFDVIPPPFEFIDTTIIESGTSGQFTDKPWSAIDIPRGHSMTVVNGQQIHAFNVYLVYSVFLGDSPTNQHNKIMFVRSTDCGNTWKKPIKLSESNQKNQGTTLAIDPETGDVYVIWRRFQSNTETDAIMFCKSTNGGATFTKPEVIWDINPFDQWTGFGQFRTSAFPTIAVDDNGKNGGYGTVYVAWADRDFKVQGNVSSDSRIVITASTDGGMNWSFPEQIEATAEHSHQFMPTLSFAAGRLMAAWYDSLKDFSGGISNFVNDYQGSNGILRRTIDVRAARGNPGSPPWFEESFQVSRYIYVFGQAGMNGPYHFWQLQFNPPNYPLFQQVSVPFIGDYIDISPSPMYLVENGDWRFNTLDTDPSDFNLVWTDNRDVDHNCTDTTGRKNQNVYTSRLSEGVEAGSPGNFKLLGAGDIAFVVFVKNNFGTARHFRLSIENLGGAQASFVQADNPNYPVETIYVSIPGYSSVSRSVFARSSSPTDSVRVLVVETDQNFIDIPGGLHTSVLLNPDETNPFNDPNYIETHNLSITNPNIENPNIENPNIENPNIENANLINPNIENPNIENTNFAYVNYSNPNIENPNIENYSYLNPNIENPNIENPNIENPNIENSALVGMDPETLAGYQAEDYTWKVTNDGDTVSSYAFTAASNASIPGDVLATQLLIYRIHALPTSPDCINLETKPHHELLVNIANPNIENPNIENPNIENPNIENPNIENSTFFLAPGDEAQVILRVIKPKPPSGSSSEFGSTQSFNPDDFANSLAAAVTPHALNPDGTRAVSGSPVKFMTPSTLPPGKEGVAYSTQLIAFGGEVPYDWSWTPSALPPGMTLVPDTVDVNSVPENYRTATVSGTPTASGTYTFSVTISSDGHTSTRTFSIFIESTLKITTPSPLPDGLKYEYYSLTFIAEGGTLPYSWSVDDSNKLPPGISLSGDGVLSGVSDGPGPYTFKVTVMDSLGATASKDFSLFINPLPLIIQTTQDDIKPGNLGTRYPTVTLSVLNGESPVFWQLADGTSLPPGLELTAGGEIAGTPIYDPNGEYPHDYMFTVSVTDKFTNNPPERFAGRIAKSDLLTLTVDLKQEILLHSSNLAGDDEPSAATSVITAVVSSGDVFYAAGYAINAVDSGSGSDYYLVKYNNSGMIWERFFNGADNGEDKATAVAVYPSTGNVYLTGHSEGKTTGQDFWTMIVSASGEKLDEVFYDGPSHRGDIATAIAVDSLGNAYVTGRSFRGNVDPHADYETIKYDDSLNLIWEARYDDRRNGHDEPLAIAVNETATGGVYVTGRSQDSKNNKSNLHFDYYTVRYNIDTGDMLSEARYNGFDEGADEARGIAIDPSGNVFVTGRSTNLNGLYDFCTVKYDNNLQGETPVRYENGEAASIVADSSGIYVAGKSGQNTDSDFFTVMYDTNMNPIWSHTFNAGSSDEATTIAIGADEVFVSGFSTGQNGKDLFTIKYGLYGNPAQWQPLWIARYDGSAHGEDKAVSIIVDNSGHVYVVGFTTATSKDLTTLKYLKE